MPAVPFTEILPLLVSRLESVLRGPESQGERSSNLHRLRLALPQERVQLDPILHLYTARRIDIDILERLSGLHISCGNATSLL